MFTDMENKVYEILGIDRNQFFFRMKYEYNQCKLPCDSQSVRRDRDIKNFVWVVKTFKLITPLYIEVLPRVLQFNNVDEEKAFGAFNFDSGSNQMSSPSLSKQVESRLVDEGNI